MIFFLMYSFQVSIIKISHFKHIKNQPIQDVLLNCNCFTSFSYKISLIKCFMERSFEICNNRNSFHNDIENINSNLIKNAYPPLLIDKVIKNYLENKFSRNQNQFNDNMMFITLNYHISATFHTTLKINF